MLLLSPLRPRTSRSPSGLLTAALFSVFPQKSTVDVGSAKMSLADRMKILKDKEEQWKDKGKGAANDSVQFTVAGRMAKKGTRLECALPP